MNLLAVDIGNSHMVLGVFCGQELAFHARFPSRPDYTEDEVTVLVHQWLQYRNAPPIGGVALCSVVPRLEHVVERALKSLFSVPLLVVHPGIKTGIAVRYENPKEVGADRIVNAVAAYEEVKGGVIVVDFGTAITFDCIGPDGAYLGGAIAPGLQISAEALFRHTAKLPFVDPEPPERVVGRNTVESLCSGLFFGFVSLVEGMVKRLREEMGPVPVWATGGGAGQVAQYTSVIDRVDPWLTLKGLRILFFRNQGVGRGRVSSA